MEPSNAPPRTALVGLLILLAALYLGRIAYTSSVDSATYDENAHIGEALRWRKSGRPLFDGFQSPLPRLAIALGPRLAGYTSELPWLQHAWERQDFDSYWESLRLARAGVFPFAVLLLGTVAWAARRYGGPGAVLPATVLASFCPTVLGHSALATLDIPGAAAWLVAAVCVYRWSSAGDFRSALVAGLAVGFAQACKFSALGFLAVPLLYAILRLRFARRVPIGRVVGQVTVLGVAAFLVVWASYGFETGPIFSYRHGRHANTETELPIGRLLQGKTAPAPHFWTGFVDMAYLQAEGHRAFFLGEMRMTGWPQYFPVALVVKATPALLLFALWGLARAAPRGRRRRTSAGTWRLAAWGSWRSP